MAAPPLPGNRFPEGPLHLRAAVTSRAAGRAPSALWSGGKPHSVLGVSDCVLCPKALELYLGVPVIGPPAAVPLQGRELGMVRRSFPCRFLWASSLLQC